MKCVSLEAHLWFGWKFVILYQRGWRYWLLLGIGWNMEKLWNAVGKVCDCLGLCWCMLEFFSFVMLEVCSIMGV